MPKILSVSLILLALALGGCNEQLPVSVGAMQAKKNFEDLCREEFKYNIVTRQIGKTLWVYLPGKDPLFDIKASPEGPQESEANEEKWSVLFVAAEFSGGDFIIRYDIQKIRQYKKDYGYKSAYSENYQRRQNNVLMALKQSFFDAKSDSSHDLPEFVVLVIADTESGIETESLFNMDDFKKSVSMPPVLPPEEWMKRFLTEIRGAQSIINDIRGRHLTWDDITWPIFLNRQIKNRISFQFQQSDFPPLSSSPQEIGKIAKETLKAYGYKNFARIRLKDLSAGTEYVVK